MPKDTWPLYVPSAAASSRTVKEVETRAGANTLNLQFEGGQEVSGMVADASGALLCRNPDALADALLKISADPETLDLSGLAGRVRVEATVRPSRS